MNKIATAASAAVLATLSLSASAWWANPHQPCMTDEQRQAMAEQFAIQQAEMVKRIQEQGFHPANMGYPMADVPPMPELPAAPQFGQMPELPTMPEFPAAPQFGQMPELPTMPEFPAAPQFGQMPELPAMPEFAHHAPVMPEMPAFYTGIRRPERPIAAGIAERRQQMEAKRAEARKAAETRRAESIKAIQERRAIRTAPYPFAGPSTIGFPRPTLVSYAPPAPVTESAPATEQAAPTVVAEAPVAEVVPVTEEIAVPAPAPAVEAAPTQN